MQNLIFGANWYVEERNLRLLIAKLQLPTLGKDMETLVLGGGWFNLAVPGAIKELESPFSLNGSDAGVRSLFGREPGDEVTFTYYERLRDITKKNTNYGRVVRLKGLVNEVKQPEVTGKKAETSDYVLGSIILYHDIQDGKTTHRIDVFKNQLVINGNDYTRQHNRMIAA